MRLTEYEKLMIKRAFQEIFGAGEIYLFGSRVDDQKRGGDLDLYLRPKKILENQLEQKIKFLVKLDQDLGEQKIDVVISEDPNRLIEREALEKGIQL